MKTFEISFLVLVFLIFFVTVFYYFYETVSVDTDQKYQTIYYLNHPRYNRGHRWRRRGKFYCPRGCNNKGQCKHGNFCYNCHRENPHCCCYDSQCSGCVKR